MGYKTRGSWSVGICLKTCYNRGVLCKKCYKLSEYRKEKRGVFDEKEVPDLWGSGRGRVCDKESRRRGDRP